ncbi:MAG: 30S ribosomal protein S9 [candidate division WOR-3 bacterium]|uniref:30S ribosomal protein S9 n=1 Tax=candidate division WOR-3 bacterium TaxID=2052148 RepID=A0A7V4EDF1_UNCW3
MNEIYFATGSRKCARIRIRLRKGKGEIIVNGKKASEYFKRQDLIFFLREPFRILQKEGEFDVIAKADGGGVSAQAQALRLAIARALVLYNEGFRKVLKTHGLLTRDPREKERMKYGLTKRRRAHQYSKR